MDQVRIGKRAAEGENGAEAHDDGPPPIRRSARIAGRDSAMKIRPIGGATPINSTKRGLSESSSNGQNGAIDHQVADEEVKRKKKKAEIEAAVEKKKKEEEEAKRKEEEEKEMKIMIEQAAFDEEGEALYNELKSVVRRISTSEEARQQLTVITQLIVRLTDGISKASNGVGTAMMEFTLGDARDMKRNMEIQLEKLIKAEKEEIKKKEEEQRKKKEEEEIIKKEEEERIMREKDDERREKNRMEASMIDKECRICFDEIKDGMGCMLCKQVLGCKTCVTDWLKTDKSCPTCRRPYSNVSKQIKKVERMNDPITPNSSAKKTPIAPTRRSLRGHASPM
ncbi:hypothetical protein PRIPAC_72374 [Pristionchus pacificus]|uniref:RING-type domain-containing protein n=1 Tax=Pristionchus pacificus TaxID=54126 RepID=A0A454XVE9_PRIPA|nr:hypothetical protein PRIPAC_72374 [Pristionchus pacificus]|eukprot:PDM64903.1 hypothetical protein PRIPAC_53159 [Pristionchus pacificus]